ncbi:MAG: flagellar hook-basal body complex protein FliE [Candidatus Gastranaerophilales bacterium]|nr:flagellar hook-basal body complex protein FliE [Candidatus Gastranaerophilales bacterium]
MTGGISPNINLGERIEPSKISTFNTPVRMKSIEQPETADFKTVMGGLVEQLNTDLNAPDQLMQDLMLDKADIHDVMAAMEKSEIQLSIATTALGNVIQTYEKVMQISI